VKLFRFFFLLVFLCRPMTAVEPASIYRITGVVISSVDETPVAHAHLNAVLTGRGQQVNRFASGISAEADEHGRFTVTLPSAGAWRLTANAAGYVNQAYEEHDGYSSAVVLSAATPTIDLHFRLSPEATITGAVLDEAGEAVRDARVTLQRRAAASPDREVQPFQNRMMGQTDDRGIYEFANLSAGDYRIMVDAKPWYSQSSQPRSTISPSSDAPLPDPTLDVTYQLTWYPGVDVPEQAEILSLKAADSRRADFHMVPIPAVHLQFTLPTNQESQGGRSMPLFPVLDRIDTGSNGSGIAPGRGSTVLANSQQEHFDIGGLAPGLYRMRIQGQDRSTQTSIIEINPGSSRLVDASTMSAQIANIAINFDSGEEGFPSGVELKNAETGQRFTLSDTNIFLPANVRRGPQSRTPQQTNLQVPPGRYEVGLMGRGNFYLTGITGKGVEISGRFITVPAGDITLTLHAARGHATVNGIATADGKPVVGAMVLLVPAGLDDPNSFTILVRDQTNTDGSFDLSGIVPGPYILVAVDHGWAINWRDPSTLQRYLMQGVPLDLHAGANLKQDITAQAP